MSMENVDDGFEGLEAIYSVSLLGYHDGVMTDDTYARAYCIIAGIDWDDVAGWRWDGDRIEISLTETATRSDPSD